MKWGAWSPPAALEWDKMPSRAVFIQLTKLESWRCINAKLSEFSDYTMEDDIHVLRKSTPKYKGLQM